jgi:transcriptional regulator with XRE-family HTH domain
MEFATVLRWLDTNKEWLFSGVGLAIFSLFSWLYHRIRSTNREQHRSVKENLLKETPEISARLKKTLDLINSARDFEKLTISKIAQMMDSSSVGEIERIFEGIDEPSLAFLRAFSERFGVQEAWLLHGEQQPFHQPEPFELFALDYLPYIKKTDPEELYFVKSTSEEGECLIVLKHDDWRYHVLNSFWHVSSHVGGTGTAQLVSLYKLIKLLDEDTLKHKCRGQVLDKNKFSELMNGEIFPGSVLSRLDKNHDWWVAFPDLNHEFPSSPQYASWYGQSFLDAQEIVRNTIRAGN